MSASNTSSSAASVSATSTGKISPKGQDALKKPAQAIQADRRQSKLGMNFEMMIKAQESERQSIIDLEKKNKLKAEVG